MSTWNPQDPSWNQPPAQPTFNAPPSAGAGRGAQFWVRLIGAVVLALAALAIYFGMAPTEKTSATDRADLALTLNKQNEADADSAPKQAVVNGWVARDLLTIIASESDRTDDRPAALLTLGIVGIAFLSATRPNTSVGRPNQSTGGIA